MLVSGVIEILFSLSALIALLAVMEPVGAKKGDPVQTSSLALVSLLGNATLGLGIGALAGRSHLDMQGGLAAAYGIGAYNVIGAAVLYFFGTGPVKGFAVTLSIGILSSLFTAVVVSRLIFDYVLSRSKTNRLSI